MENISSSRIVDFQEQLKPIKTAFDDLLKQFNIKNGITIKVSDGQIRTFIDVEELR